MVARRHSQISTDLSERHPRILFPRRPLLDPRLTPHTRPSSLPRCLAAHHRQLSMMPPPRLLTHSKLTSNLGVHNVGVAHAPPTSPSSCSATSLSFFPCRN
uniref:Uncharacterized protein n=1 Tax=Physcomitrium patens TaxID=3218 RepID=A0A2K1L2H6_PHYPA|nr:hypothetical protein PHYPA_003026 [Physcomitrium patens]